MAKTLKEIGAVGVLDVLDLVALNAGTKRVFDLMKNGAWCGAREICLAARGAEGLRRLRELRPYYEVDRRKQMGTRSFEYRLRTKYPEPEQLRLIK